MIKFVQFQVWFLRFNLDFFSPAESFICLISFCVVHLQNLFVAFPLAECVIMIHCEPWDPSWRRVFFFFCFLCGSLPELHPPPFSSGHLKKSGLWITEIKAENESFFSGFQETWIRYAYWKCVWVRLECRFACMFLKLYGLNFLVQLNVDWKSYCFRKIINFVLIVVLQILNGRKFHKLHIWRTRILSVLFYYFFPLNKTQCLSLVNLLLWISFQFI